jgi:gas vesicle protein
MSDNSTRNLLVGFLSGAVLGGIIALLYAPKPGKELRGDLRRKGGEIAEDIEEYLQDAQDKARTIINEGKERSSALISDAKRKAETLLKDAEHIMSDARSRMTEESGKLKSAVKAGVDAYKDERDKGSEASAS